MSEKLLGALLELFAIIAKKGSVTIDERAAIKSFLESNLSEESAERHMHTFDGFAKHIGAQEDEDPKRIESICRTIKAEFTYYQKVVLVLQLLELILADGEIADEETAILNSVTEKINVPASLTKAIKDLALSEAIEAFDKENYLIISSPSGKLPTVAHHFEESNIDGFLAVLYLPETEMYFVKYLGATQLSLNGVPLRNDASTLFPPGSTIKGEKSQSIYYSDIVSRFKQGADSANITFEAKNIDFVFPNGKKGLNDINIVEETGKLVGLMGASGSGKSTLLNVLNGNERPSSGHVYINGIDIHQQPEAIQGIIGYVPQDDLLIEELTVQENLYFAAKLCFSNKNSIEINSLVSSTLSALGLSETRHLRVGSPLDKTISGGQRKRLNIGLELLREPSVLFVDEPTSGLSSRDSENIMDLLKELSLKGKMVFVVIHQPSSDIFRMFDKLVILDVGGFQIYYGNPVEAVTYFKHLTHAIDRNESACIECGNVNPEQIFNIIETKVVDEYGKVTTERKVSPNKWNKLFAEQANLQSLDSIDELPHPELHIPNWFHQIKLFFQRDFKSKLANKQYLLINLLEAPLLALLLAYIIRYYPDGEGNQYLFSDNANIPAFFFMSIIVALFMGLTVSAEEIIKDRKILKRESFLHLSRSSYLISKIGILFMFSAIQTLTYVLIGDIILEIDGLSMVYWGILFSVACFANLLGLNISSAFNSAITIYILIPILLIPQLILSGVVVKFDYLNPQITVPDQVPLVGELMASRWAFEAAMVAQYKLNEYNEPFYPLDQRMAESEYKTVYYIPALETKLNYLANHINEVDSDKFQQAVNLLKREIGLELKIVGENQFDAFHKLTPVDFDKWTADKTDQFLKSLTRFYNNRYNEASSKKEKGIYILTNTAERRAQFEYLKSHYYNQAVASMVKNTNDPDRLVEFEGKFVQKIYPIFMNPQPKHMLDFRTQFYTGKKYFLGYYFDTLGFNMAIIWFMISFLYFSLYFDLLRKLINFKK
jgi:ABC-type multidrug transport system ATPase subunit/uncharacterized tellurite resistance protein B-like protein